MRNTRPRLSLGRALAVALAAVSLASLTTGCSVMDEMDKAAAKMPTKGKAADAKAGNGKPLDAAGRLAAAKSQADQNAKKWWSQAKTMTPGQRPEGIVHCALGGELRFMSREDCAVQGGTPRGGSS